MNWIKNNRLEFLVIIIILSLSAFMRFYKIDQYMTFLGDEGRDVLVIKKILEQFDLPLLGPPTSVGNMYLGPLYYYMMAIPMAIFWLNPVAAAGMVAAIGTATVGLIYYLSRKWFGMAAAIIASVLYSFSPVNVYYSMSSWNPNPAPFFTLLIFLGLYKAYKSNNYLWMILVGTAFAFALQMHYLTLILLPIIVVLFFYDSSLNRKEKVKIKNKRLGTTAGILVFLTLMSPLVIFDLKHNLMNYRAVTTFFFGDRATTVNLNIFNTVERIIPIYQKNLIASYITGDNMILVTLVSLLVLIPVLITLFNLIKRRSENWPNVALSFWLITGIMGLALYKQSIFDHYLGFLNPVPFIIIGSLTTLGRYTSKYFKENILIMSIVALSAVIAIINLQRSPLLKPPNNQLQKTQDVTRFVIAQSADKPFNFALIAKSNYDAAYQFYFEQFNHKPKQVPFDITEQLFVVCEDPICEPINHPKYEIAAFGWSKIESVKEFGGVKVYKLIHNRPDK